WRRSLYTYWKRACPPPSMLTFDAPTREFCTIRRTATSTALQALVLWNDEQFVEAARVLAQRTLAERAEGAEPPERSEPSDSNQDRNRLARMFRRCAGRVPDGGELELLQRALAQFRDRYRAAPDEAKKLVAVGASPL